MLGSSWKQVLKNGNFWNHAFIGKDYSGIVYRFLVCKSTVYTKLSLEQSIQMQLFSLKMTWRLITYDSAQDWLKKSVRFKLGCLIHMCMH